MIVLNDLSKRFDENLVVDTIDLTIKPGQILGLLGPNGAGKTTTLRMISGVLPPTSGSIEINGKNIHDPNYDLRGLIGYLPENNPLYDDLTVEEFLRFWGDIKGIATAEIKQAIDFVVEHTGIAEVYYRPIGELSKGYRQRVGLSQAILTKPEILILDEPTEGLDPNQRQDIQSLIRSLGKNRTIILSSHVLSEVSKICTRIVIINKGQIVADDTPERLRHANTKTHIIEVEIKGTKVVSTLKVLPGVLSVDETDKNNFVVTVEKGKDIREKIFYEAVKHKWTLLTLVKKDIELEEVFRQLTSD